MPANRTTIARNQMLWSGIIYTAVCIGAMLAGIAAMGAAAGL